MLTPQRMKEVREDNHFSIDEMAIFLGVKPSTIIKYETSNVRRIPFKQLAKLEEAFKINPSWVLGRSSQKYILMKGEKKMIELGQEARDKITGFEGIITARATFLYGCDQYGLAPKVKEDGTIKETQYFDEGRIEIIGRGILPEEVKAEKAGGVSRDVPRGRY